VPQPESIEEEGDVEYIVRGSSPVYSAMGLATAIMFIIAILLGYMELREYYDFPVMIFF
jgi:hypothetical protein